MASTRSLYVYLVCAFFIVVISVSKLQTVFIWPFAPANELVVTKDYTGDVGALFTGAHRLAGDIAYINFLQYYGMHEQETEEEEHKKELSDKNHIHDVTAGRYPLMLECGERILHLDALFSKGLLEVAGSLAFNIKRPDQALTLLHDAIKYDPSFYRYRLYAAAILYKNSGQDSSLIHVLAEAINYSDCPLLLKNVLANLYRKYNQFDQAAKVYVNIAQTAMREGDRNDAKKHLLDILMHHPELSRSIPSHFPE